MKRSIMPGHWRLPGQSGQPVAWSEAAMTNVTRIRHAMPVSAEMNKAIADLDAAVAKAIDAAKAIGLPQGFVVSILHGHAHAQTAILVK
jgi:hypothetical protein